MQFRIWDHEAFKNWMNQNRIGVKELADWLGVSATTIVNWRNPGKSQPKVGEIDQKLEQLDRLIREKGVCEAMNQ